MTGGTDHDIGHGGGAGARASNRVRFPGPDDHKIGEDVKVTTHLPNGWVCESSREVLPVESYRKVPDPGEGHYAAGLLAQARAEDRVRWQGRAAWHPVLTYSTVMIASGWLAGAWYAWQIDADGATMAMCLVGALSTVFPGIPWRELLEMSRRPAEERPTRSADEIPSGTTMEPESTGYTGHAIASRERLRPAGVRREEASGRSVGVSDSVAEVRRCDEA
jgi:hypothetical protein